MTKKRIYLYARTPIDFWVGWIPEKEFIGRLKDAYFLLEDVASAIHEYIAFRRKATELARSVGWEGDFSEGPFVAGLPDNEDSSSLFMVGWKQSNNGDTFIASPLRLPWMEEDESIEHTVGEFEVA